MKIYRKIISPLYGDVCRYYPTCSSYTLQSIQQFGLIRGSFKGLYRILRCNPWGKGGIDEVKQRLPKYFDMTSFGFVIPKARRG